LNFNLHFARLQLPGMSGPAPGATSRRAGRSSGAAGAVPGVAAPPRRASSRDGPSARKKVAEDSRTPGTARGESIGKRAPLTDVSGNVFAGQGIPSPITPVTRRRPARAPRALPTRACRPDPHPVHAGQAERPPALLRGAGHDIPRHHRHSPVCRGASGHGATYCPWQRGGGFPAMVRTVR